MPLFQTPIQLDVLAHPGSVAATAATAVTAGSAYFTSVTIPAGCQAIVTQMRCAFSGTPTGNCDMGIYDATAATNLPGNLLGHTGANAAANGVFTKSLGSTLILGPGIYWLAWLDTVADSVFMRPMSAAGIAPNVKTSATNLTVLPNSGGAVANQINMVGLFALTQNGWS